MALEPCAIADDGRICALEYNLAARRQPNAPPTAGIAVHVRGDGALAAVRFYDDVQPPPNRRAEARTRSESGDTSCTSR
jgi:hypothetical protein